MPKGVARKERTHSIIVTIRTTEDRVSRKVLRDFLGTAAVWKGQPIYDADTGESVGVVKSVKVAAE